MTGSAAIQASLYGSHALPLRPAGQVMQLERLGAMHQSRLSFMRSLVRRIMRERWQITPALMELDDQGYGRVIYRIQAPQGCYSFVLFSDYLSPEDRNDRVIATKWDLTMALVAGDLAAEVAAGDESYLQKLRDNVPKQEAGRVDSRVFVLSRANRSARNFDYVVEQLARGEQPDAAKIAKVGYLYRTTAVYGSGKLGMADWQKCRATGWTLPGRSALKCLSVSCYVISACYRRSTLPKPAARTPLHQWSWGSNATSVSVTLPAWGWRRT